jgi:alkylation response protein AidB-like acyl-CoA dehydrogenase
MDQLTDILRQYSKDAEAQGRLHPAQLEIIRSQRWFHLFVPERYGGLELTLPEIVRLE